MNIFDLVFVINKNKLWYKSSDLFIVKLPVASDDHQIAFFGFPSCGTVDADIATLTRDRIGCEAFPIGDVIDIDLLKRFNPRGFKKDCINGDATFILEVGIRYRRPMNLRSQKCP